MATDVTSRGEVLSSPTFEDQGSWSAGYALAKDGGPGVVVGPGHANENVFIQTFPTAPGAQYKVTLTATSGTNTSATASVQINWMDAAGGFVSASFEFVEAGEHPTTATYVLAAPPGAALGIVHVIPGYEEPVRYTQMSVFRLDPVQDFAIYRFFGVPGLEGTGVVLAVLAAAATLAIFRRRIAAAWPTIMAGLRAGFPLIAIVLCIVLLLGLEPYYEQAYDAQYHQGWVEVMLQWKSLSLDLGGSPMRSMGIQPLTNPLLSPTFLLGWIMPADVRIPAQAAFLAVVMLLMSAAMARAAGLKREDAYAVGLIAQAYGWHPLLTWYQATLNATLGILWQETAAAAMLALFLYLRIGMQPRGRFPWAAVGLAVLLVWYLLSLPHMIPFFALATGAMCLGATVVSASLRELLQKVAAGIAILIMLVAIGGASFAANLFLYTPQMFYRTTYMHSFETLFFQNTSLVMSAVLQGNWTIFVFFGFIVVGLFSALISRNPYARRIAGAAIGLEVMIHGISGLNLILKLVPLTFTYVEQVGLPLLALFAGFGVWTVLEVVGRLAEQLFFVVRPRPRLSTGRAR